MPGKSKLIHKYVQETEAGKSAWAILCSPMTLNCKVYNKKWKMNHASFRWKNVTCMQCLRLKKMTTKERYSIREGLEWLLKGQLIT